MHIAVVHDWEPNFQQEMDWKDGLAAAIRELIDRGNDVTFVTCGKYDYTLPHDYFTINVTADVPNMVNIIDPDVILTWADMTRPNAQALSKLGKPMAIAFAGGNPFGPNADLFDLIFTESKIYYDTLKAYNYPVKMAFGTNTDLFTPIPEQPKLFDTIFPATFADWKRHTMYAEAVNGLKSLAVGYYVPHEMHNVEVCRHNGVAAIPHANAETLHALMAASKVCVITSASNGGSQRTVLEAMAMDIPVLVTDSDKFDWAGDRIYRSAPNSKDIRGYLDAMLDGELEAATRQFVVDNWSHIKYADALEEGLQSIL